MLYNSLILTPKGYKKLMSVRESIVSIGGINMVLSVKKEKVKMNLFEIKPQNMFSMFLMKNQKVMTQQGWKEAQDLLTDDYVAIPRIPITSNYDEIKNLLESSKIISSNNGYAVILSPAMAGRLVYCFLLDGIVSFVEYDKVCTVKLNASDVKKFGIKAEGNPFNYEKDDKFFYVKIDTINIKSHNGNVYLLDTSSKTYTGSFCVHV